MKCRRRGRRRRRPLRLHDRADLLATRSLREVLAVLRRSITHAQRRDRILRNVITPVTVPEGRPGQAQQAAHVVRKHGDAKARKSRRTLALPHYGVRVLVQHQEWQQQERRTAGLVWVTSGLVFATKTGNPLDASHVRRDFRTIVVKTGLAPEWTPRELRHSFVSLLSTAARPPRRRSTGSSFGQSSPRGPEPWTRSFGRARGTSLRDRLGPERRDPIIRGLHQVVGTADRGEVGGSLVGSPGTIQGPCR